MDIPPVDSCFALTAIREATLIGEAGFETSFEDANNANAVLGVMPQVMNVVTLAETVDSESEALISSLAQKIAMHHSYMPTWAASANNIDKNTGPLASEKSEAVTQKAFLQDEAEDGWMELEKEAPENKIFKAFAHLSFEQLNSESFGGVVQITNDQGQTVVWRTRQDRAGESVLRQVLMALGEPKL